MTEQDDDTNRSKQSDEDYPLAPSEPESAEDKRIWYPGKTDEPPEAEPPQKDRFQFSLAELLLLMAAASFFLSILGFLPEQYAIQNFAGLAGLGVLLSLIVLAFTKPARPIIHIGWWAMLLLYLLACVAALIKD